VIKLGTSGFHFKDWVGPVYPKNLPEREWLTYYERTLGFDTLELNFTYYTLPSVRSFEGMLRKTSDRFDFVVKANRFMTHDMIEKKTLRIIDNADSFDKFTYSLGPLREAGRLGGVLAQFPVFFLPRRETYDYLRTFVERMEGTPLIFEFRNKAWMRDSMYAFLEENNVGYCVVDEPKLPRLVPFDPRVTSKDIGYFRFHGRNEKWFKASREERYNYLYSKDEMSEFLPAIREVETQVGRTYLYFNNCHAGQAPRNAEMMRRLLGLTHEPPPGSDSGEQEEMFGG
jgi:uncharacterized protein YecE (DUF72 family)